MINRMWVCEAQFNNRIIVIAEKWSRRKNFHICGRKTHNLGENQTTFGGESVHIDHCTSEDFEMILAWRYKMRYIAGKFLGDCAYWLF